MRPMAAKAALRARQKRWRSASSRAIRTSVAPASVQKRSTSSKRASHSRSEPSSSTSSAAPASSGKPAWAIGSAAWMARLSIISIAPGTTPARVMADTASPACSGESKKATSVRTASGTGTTRRVILVTSASVPSEPTSAPSRSRPGRSACGPPTVTSVPSVSTASTLVT